MQNRPIDKNTFIAETARDIFAAMFTRPDKDQNAQVAIECAEELWDQLKRSGYDLTKTPTEL